MKEWNETYKTAAAVHEERENSCSFRFYLIYFTILRVLLECLILILIERERETERMFCCSSFGQPTEATKLERNVELGIFLNFFFIINAYECV